MTICICGAGGGKPFTVAERMLGLGDEFTYLECPECGSLRIGAVPMDLGRYYPSNYYSFAPPAGGLRTLAKNAAMTLALSALYPDVSELRFPWARVVQRLGITRGDRVLDVGSGANGMATQLRAAGHRLALGIDPFIAADVRDENGIAVRKAFLAEMEPAWDLIAFNHSLEHVPDPLKDLSTAAKLLASGGRIVVRIPVAAYAWREYGPFWFQIDAPRHLFVPTERGFNRLAPRCGLQVTRVVYDSEYKQFWHSEQYRRGLSLVAVAAHHRELITRSQRRQMIRRARELNRSGQGDQAAFFLGAA